MITYSKDNYFAELGRKLSNPNNGPKTYWTTLNRIINKKDDKYPSFIGESIVRDEFSD